MDSHDEDKPQAHPPLVDDSTRRAEKSPSTGFATLASTYRDVAPYLGLGIQLAATIVVCFFLGRWLDQALNTAPWLTIIGAFIGAAGGLYNFLKTVIELDKKQKDKQSAARDAKR